MHHCGSDHALHRMGGVCLLPVARGHDRDGRGGVVVSWTAHELLSRDADEESTSAPVNGMTAQEINDAAVAVAAYLKSLEARKPLSERKLAAMFGKTSTRCRGFRRFPSQGRGGARVSRTI
jgi:hypothetical protein